jgi:hypothetical protein
MTFTYKLSRRLALGHLGLTAFAAGVIAACSGGEPTSPATSGTSDLLAAVKIAPKKATIETNQTIRFSGTGISTAGDSMATSIEWTATGGSITADGVLSAHATGTLRVIGKALGHNKSDTSTVVVVPPQPTLTTIVVSPDPATVTEGKAASFSASGKLSDGSTAPIGVVWGATGGTIDAGGNYTAGMTPGAFRVVATNTSSTVADTVPVTVTAAQLAQIVLAPATVTLVPGGTQQFTGYGRTSTGDSISTPVSFTATGGTVSAGGLYTAGQTTGSFRVIATSTTTNLADTSAVTIQPAGLAQLIMVPAVASVAIGGTMQFQIYGRTTAGDSVAAQATYTATGGTITSGGLYTAGSIAGTFRVSASTTSGLADSAVVTVSASSSGSRNPLTWPFASTSIWNMPIGSGAVYVAANLNPNPDNYQWADMPRVDGENIVLKPTAPLTSIMYSSAGWTGANRCAATGGVLFQAPIPTGYVVPNGNTNNSAAFLQADGRSISQSQPFTRCTAGGYATSITFWPTVDIYGAGITGSHGGSGLSALGGTIRLGELRPGGQGPRHALKVLVYAYQALYQCTTSSACYRWPATNADGYAVGRYGAANGNQNTAMKMGALLGIPASVNLASLNLETDPGRQLAWTLQNYGAYIVDDTWGPSFGVAAEDGPDGSFAAQFQADYGYSLHQFLNSGTPWLRDIQRLMQALWVVDNNGPNSIGGGGTPLQALAPPLQ